MSLWGGGGDVDDAIRSLQNQMAQGQAQLSPSIQNLLALLSGVTASPTLPSLPQDVLDQLMAQYNMGADELTKRIGQEQNRMLGDLAAKSATQWIMGSSAQGRATGAIGRGSAEALSTGLTELERGRISDMLALQNALLQSQTANLGTYGSFLGGMQGNQMAGYGALAQLLGAQAQQNQGLYGLIGGATGGAVNILDLLGVFGGGG
jgi:hypothetical protein